MPALLRLRFVVALVVVVIASATLLIVRHIDHADAIASAKATALAQKLELEQMDARAMRKIRVPADFVASSSAECVYPCWIVHRSSESVARQVLPIFRSTGAVLDRGSPLVLNQNGCRTFIKSIGIYAVCNYLGTIEGNAAWIIMTPRQTCVAHRCRIDRESQLALTLPGQS
jgi:hypothetical protein